MSWEPVETRRTKASRVMAGIYIHRHKLPVFFISVPSAIVPAAWNDAGHVSCFMGRGEHAGGMLVKPAEAGVKLARLRHTVNIRFSPPPDMPQFAVAAQPIDMRETPEGVVFTLPDFSAATPPGPAAAAAEKPPRMAGDTLLIGDEKIPLQNKPAALMRAVIAAGAEGISASEVTSICTTLAIARQHVGRINEDISALGYALRLSMGGVIRLHALAGEAAA